MVQTFLEPVLSFKLACKAQFSVFREHSFFYKRGRAGGIQGRVINFLPARKGRVSINLTQQRGGSLKFYCFQGEGHIFGCEILHSCS